MKANTITYERLTELLDYDQETGDFTWKVGRTRLAKPGTKAGRPLSGDYWRICVDGVDYSAHRLAWLYVTGAWPTGEVDHINKFKSDNRFCNLRDVSRGGNQQNKGIQKNNKSGIVGVHWSKKDKRWRAAIRKDGVTSHLCNFKEIADAAAAYAKAKAVLHV